MNNYSIYYSIVVHLHHVLKTIPKLKYSGPGLLYVNGNSLAAANTSRLKFSLGSPELTIEIDFVIVDELPYSCVVWINLLNTLKNWGVDSQF